MKICILEDEPEHAAQLVAILEPAGHRCDILTTGGDLLRTLARDSHDLLILDWMVPETSGIETLIALRGRFIDIPVLFVTARDAEEDVVTALRAGADDYLIKPPRPDELLARIEVLRRRAVGGDRRTVMMSPYRFDIDAGEVWLNDECINLTARQFSLAILLFRQPGRLFSRDHLLAAIWGVGAQVQTRTLDIHISRLRVLLRMGPENGWRIASVYGYGYRLERFGDV
jgi:DNA-binding response OmpR family regulator